MKNSQLAEYPAPEILKRLEHEYSLREELDPMWVARPITMARHWDRTVLVLEDPGGVPLDQLLGQQLEVAFSLRLAISLSRAIDHLHQRDTIHNRLNVFPLRVAALRERKEDIPLLATHFVELLVSQLGCPKPRLARAGLETLQYYDWPGNIRELRNVIERAVISARGGALEFDLPETDTSVDLTTFGTRDDQVEPEYLTESEMRRRERENMFAVLRKAGWKIKGVDGAAELLGVKPTTLSSRIEKMGLK